MSGRLFILVGVIMIFLVQIVSAQEGLPIKKIRISNNEIINSGELLKQMNTKSMAFVSKIIPWKKDEGFSQHTLDEDILRLKKIYQKNGFLKPQISYELLPNKKNKKLSIHIKIVEGETIVINKLNFNHPIDKLPLQLMDSLKKAIPLKPLIRFRDNDVFTSEKIIKNGFSSNGFPFIEIERTIQLKQEDNIVNLSFNIKPGEKSYFGDIELKADTFAPISIIKKNLSIKKGDIYGEEKIEKAQQELFDLGLFRYVTIRALLDSVSNNYIPVIIQVKQLPRWALKTGFGYGTEDKVRLSILLTRLNFLGGARSLILKAQHSYFNPLNLDVKFIQPDFLWKGVELVVNPFYSKEREESFEVRRIGSALTFQKDISEKASAYLSYTLGNDKLKLNKDIPVTSGQITNKLNNKSGITLGYERNTTNDTFSPKEGVKINGTATYMGLGFNSRYHYYKLMLETSWYTPVAKNVVLAGKIKGGIIKAINNDLYTPIEDRFLMGGAMSLRGWGRNQISPLDEFGNKLGGNSTLEGSLELRFPIYGIFSATSFIDAGNVWKESWSAKLSNLNYNAGMGLRVKTPVGPIRFDVASPLFQGSIKPQFFITIGHAF